MKVKITQNFQLVSLLSKNTCKRRATTTGLCVKKEDKATQTVSRKVWKMPNTIVLCIQGLSPLQGEGYLFEPSTLWV